MRAYVFPGQGSQFVGMGKDLAAAFPAAKQVFEEVDDTLHQKLSALMFDGPEDALNLTRNTQPALMAVSMAVVRVLQDAAPGLVSPVRAVCVAGHSLGEYAALAAAGTLTLSDTARLLRVRGEEMQKAVPVGQGSMAAILGLEIADVARVVKDAAGEETLAVANDNCDGQVVISGHKAAVERAVQQASALGAKKAVMLPVSAPFHCPLMQPAADAMARALSNVDMQVPSLPVVANVIAEEVTQPDRIRTLLVEQVTGMVRWRESVLYMREKGITELIELGAGKVLTGLTRRIDKDIAGRAIGTPEDIDAFANTL